MSEYNRFKEKLQALAEAQTYAGTGQGAKGSPKNDAKLRTGPSDITDFSVNTNIEPFDQYEVSGGLSLEAMIMQPEEGLDETWFSKMSSNYIYTYFPDPALGIGTNSNFNYPFGEQSLRQAVKITGSGAAPRVTRQNYLNGTFPPDYANLTQKIYFYASKVAADHFTVLHNEAFAYTLTHKQAILNYYGCSEDFAPAFCLELNCDSPGQPYYSKGFKRLVTDCNPVILNFEPTFPILFRYKMPGWDQVTTTHYVNLARP